jgi:hypothetical protein
MQRIKIAEVTLFDLQQMLVTTTVTNKAMTEAGQTNDLRINKISSTLEKFMLNKQELSRTSTRVESSLDV